MTFNSDIEKTEKEIAVLQAKLELLKEIENHTDFSLVAELNEYKGGAMDCNVKLLKKLDDNTVMIDGVKYKRVEEPPSPVAKAYKDWWGQYPELETDSEYDEMRWQGFQAGFQAAYEEQVREDDYYNDKSQPRMEAERSGEVCVVFYNKRTYYRIEYTDEFGYVVWWRREKQDDTSKLVMVTDKELEGLLNDFWFNEVKGGKYD